MSAAGSEPCSIIQLFRRILQDAPDRPLLTFVDDKGDDEETITAAQLAAAAQGVARSLGEWGIAPGDRVVLVYPPSLDFVRAMLGCLLAGVVAVPVYPPNPVKPQHDLAGFQAIVTSSQAKAALTNGAYERARTLGAITRLLGRDRSSVPDIPWHRTDRRTGTAAEPVRWHEPMDPDEPAFLQYTSGSTSAPKGVIITHGNLSHEVIANARDLGLDEHTRGVFWVPQYHDLGLISVILSTLAGNGHNRVMSPLTFLQRPSVWFDVMSRVRATHTAAPNFAFDLAVRRTTAQQRDGWDLSSLKVVMSAAEPIREQTVERFYGAFDATGLRPDTFYPAYGLAEHTVSVAMGGKLTLGLDKTALESDRVVTAVDEGESSVRVVGCGRITKPGARVRIVHPETHRPCRPDEVGEIWVHSATKALGYTGLETETRATFRARVDDGDTAEYLRTGDLGFFYQDELFITGRYKDLLIVHGRNLYPQDLEDSLRECHPLIRPGGLAAFAVEDQDGAGEQIVVYVECREGRISTAAAEEIVAAVRRQLQADHQLPSPVVVVGKSGMVRKTTSGKVRRRACRQDFLDGIVQADPRTILVSAASHREQVAG